MTVEEMINAGDWKALLAEAQKKAEAAYAKLQVAYAEFSKEMEVVHALVEQAIEFGGDDAREKWQEFWKNFSEGLKEFGKTVREALSKFSEKINWCKNRYVIIAGLVVVIAVCAWLFSH